MLFKLKDKKELYEEVKSQWSAKCYIMLQANDLFCHTIFFAKLNMLASFNLHFRADLREGGSIYPHMIFQWSKGIVSPPRCMEESFSRSFFMTEGVHIFLGKFIWGLFYMVGQSLDHAKGKRVSLMHFPAI